jgi:phage terminase Nu1 subunit (DNA packaging protein)
LSKFKRTRFSGNHRETAELLGITPQALGNAVRERGCPVAGKDGTETVYDWREVLQWRIADLMPDDLDLTRERARLAAAQADRHEMTLAESRGDLVRIAAVVAQVGEYIDSCRKRLINLPSSIASHFDPDTGRRVETIARERVHEAVAELRAFRPWMDGSDRRSVDVAADPDGQSMGGPVPAAAGGKRGRARPVANG